ncbi:UNVERIFIED_CONTAM: hypothetical protein HDU68_011291 [Siphonaria sp. JEL0065]|nr:hypothetical protein HDU68_011291 [Siphonaria sp. JEL0065]
MSTPSPYQLSSDASVLTLAVADSSSDLLAASPSPSPLKHNQTQVNPHRIIVDSDSDSDSDRIESADALIEKLNKERPHKGPQSKAKPRKSGDVDLDVIARKLLNVGIDENPLANAIPEAEYYLPNDPSAIRYLLPTHANQIISALNHDILDYVLNAMKQIRRYMCVDEIPDKTERVLDLQVLPRIRQLLLNSNSLIQVDSPQTTNPTTTTAKAPTRQRNLRETLHHNQNASDAITLQYEACWILTNIAAGTSAHTAAVVNHDFIPPLIHLLRSSSDLVRIQAAWALGNVAGDCREYSQILLDYGIMEPLLEVPRHIDGRRDRIMQARHVVEPCFPLIRETVMNFSDSDVLSESIWALSRIFHAKNPGNSKLIEVALLRKLVSCMQSSRLSIQTPVLRVMTNISGDSQNEHTDVLIEAGLLSTIHNILRHREHHQPIVVAEVLHCLSNITAGPAHQKEAVNKAGLFVHVRDILFSFVGDAKVKKEALHVLRNTVDRDATPEQFRDVVGSQGEIFNPLTTFLVQTINDPQTQLQVIETLNIIFSRGNEPLIRALYPFAIPGTNVYVTCMNHVSQQNFNNIWEAYRQVFLCPDDDLAPMMIQCMVTEKEVQARTDIDEETKKGVVDAVVGHFRPGLTSSDIVKTEKLRKAIVRDLGIMMDLYLGEQRRRVLESMSEFDLLQSGMQGLALNLRCGGGDV